VIGGWAVAQPLLSGYAEGILANITNDISDEQRTSLGRSCQRAYIFAGKNESSDELDESEDDAEDEDDEDGVDDEDVEDEDVEDEDLDEEDDEEEVDEDE
jgi:hypothetical protein